MNALDLLKERGFVKQITFEDELYKAFDEGMVSFYVGFDPTADSLHIGHYIPIMAMAHLQKAGHKPFALMGGGTGMIGDPSGKSDLRKVLTVEDIDNNVAFVPGTHFYPDGGHLSTLRLNFSMSEVPVIEEGMKRLGQVLASL